MNTVGGAIKHVSHQLNDQQIGRTFIRWGRADVLEFLNEGMAAISGYRPEAIIGTSVVALNGGRTHTIDGYSAVITVRDAAQSDAVLSSAFAAYNACPSTPEFDRNGAPIYRLRSYVVDKDNPKVIHVEPAVPAGMTTEITVTGNTTLTPYKLSDWGKTLTIDPKYYNPLLDFMWARAYELDSESAQSRANSQTHMRNFYTAMGVQYKMESAHKSGFYLGERGDGDPRART